MELFQEVAQAPSSRSLELGFDQTTMVVTQSFLRLWSVTHLSAETDHGQHVCLCHACPKFPIENFDGLVMDVELRRKSAEIVDSKYALIFVEINHFSFYKAASSRENQLMSLAV